MNLPNKSIGGYFGLELRAGKFLHQDAILLNSGRACFEYVLRVHKPKKVYLPKFTCDVMVEPLERTGVPYEFYAINTSLELEERIDLSEGEYLVYTNYFGIKDSYASELSERYGFQLIIDNSQALYTKPPVGSHVFYSPRKFFGLSDGGCLYTDATLPEDLERDISYDRFSHLLKRWDLGAEAAYGDFKQNDAALSGVPLRQMSRLTEGLLGSIDYEAALGRRQSNAALLHEALGSLNKLPVDIGAAHCLMVYPFLVDNNHIRDKLIENKIFVATYWPNVLEWADSSETEYYLTRYLLPLPLDQRYTDQEIERIITIIKENV